MLQPYQGPYIERWQVGKQVYKQRRTGYEDNVVGFVLPLPSPEYFPEVF